MPESRWKKLGEAAQRAGTNRSEVINDFARWYTGEDDAELPERPTNG